MAQLENERIIRAAIEFAKLSIHLSPKDEPRLAIEMTEKYLQGEVSEKEVRAAARAASAVASAAAYTADAAAAAAYATAHAAYAAANVAANAVVAAVYAAKAIARASGFKQGTKEWHLKRLEVLKQCLVIARRTFGLIK